MCFLDALRKIERVDLTSPGVELDSHLPTGIGQVHTNNCASVETSERGIGQRGQPLVHLVRERRRKLHDSVHARLPVVDGSGLASGKGLRQAGKDRAQRSKLVRHVTQRVLTVGGDAVGVGRRSHTS